MELAKLRGFAKTLIYEENNLATCVSTMIQSAGIGGLTPNTIMVGWPHRWKEENDDQNEHTEYWDFMGTIYKHYLALISSFKMAKIKSLKIDTVKCDCTSLRYDDVIVISL